MKYLVVLILITLLGCFRSAELLTIKPIEFMPDNSNYFLKINGYFIEQPKQDSYQRVFFLYKNGVFLNWSSFKTEHKDSIESHIRKFIRLQYYKKTQYSWGVFNIRGNEILIDHWLSGNGGPYPVQSCKGKILNDTTISIFISDNIFNSNGLPQTYKFQKFSPKPDSTNVYIK